MDWIGLILFVMWFLNEKDLLLLLFAFLFLFGDKVTDVLAKNKGEQ